MKLTIKLTAIAALMVCTSSPSFADRASNSCRLYTDEGNKAPEDVREILAKAPATAVRVCTPTLDSEQTRYSVFSPPWSGLLGVCYMRSHELFRRRDSAGHIVWSYLPPEAEGGNSDPAVPRTELYMAKSEGRCPPQDSVNYLPTTGISEGLFLDLIKFWDGLSYDKTAFDSAFSQLNHERKTSAGFAKLRKLIVGQRNGRAPFIGSMSFLGPLPDLGLGIPSVRRSSNYVIRINNPKDPAEAYELDVDLTKNGFKVLDLKVIAI